MQITIKVFGGLKARAGTDELTLEIPAPATVRDALERLDWIDEDTVLVAAVNRAYADRSQLLEPGDEIALIPPVSGGAPEPGEHHESIDVKHHESIDVTITGDPIDQAVLTAFVADPRAGAIVTFTGVTREVPALEYEAYAEMATLEITAIAADALRRHGLCRVAVAHRCGTVELSEASVVIVVSAPHRGEAFDGAREIIDELKRRAPIWKSEEGRWLPGHLPSTRP